MLDNKASSTYKAYAKYINSSYPDFLARFGINNLAVKAEGATITDSEGTSYIDCTGGFGLHNLGHNHPQLLQSLISQLKKLQPLNKPFLAEQQVELAQLLAEISPGDLECSFICNSGSEAIDSAIKLARLVQKKSHIIAMEGGFHGYTYGALSATGIDSFKHYFGPLIPDITHVPFDNLEALKKQISTETAAVIIEPIQHEEGVLEASKSYFQEVRKLCDEYNVLLILDEIKTGFGKTGKMFACEYLGICPDVLVLGKSLGGGLIPMGALVARKSLWRKFSYNFPMSASSFAGNVLACAAAIKTIEILRDSNLISECEKMGQLLRNGLDTIIQNNADTLKSIRGKGLLLGLQTSDSETAFKLAKDMINHGVLILPAFYNRSVLMLEPPLVISKKQIDYILETLEQAILNIAGNN